MICKAGHYEPILPGRAIRFLCPLHSLLSFCVWTGYSWGSLFFLALSVVIAAFFRNPERVSPRGDDIVLSPADGRVVQIVEDVRSDICRIIPHTDQHFMSVLNVHVNRWPLSGIVKKITHVPGAFLDAREGRSLHPERAQFHCP